MKMLRRFLDDQLDGARENAESRTLEVVWHLIRMVTVHAPINVEVVEINESKREVIAQICSFAVGTFSFELVCIGREIYRANPGGLHRLQWEGLCIGAIPRPEIKRTMVQVVSAPSMLPLEHPVACFTTNDG